MPPTGRAGIAALVLHYSKLRVTFPEAYGGAGVDRAGDRLSGRSEGSWIAIEFLMSIDYEVTPQTIEYGRLLGYEPSRLPLLLLAPLVQLAWIDGSIQAAEQRAIMRLSERLTLLNAAARQELMSWLYDRPTEEILDRLLRDLRSIFSRLSTEEAERFRSFLRFGMVDVARASGGPGFVKVPSNIQKRESDAILELAAQFGLEKPDLE